MCKGRNDLMYQRFLSYTAYVFIQFDLFVVGHVLAV